MTYLLDVNVLIALLDREHVHHELATDWFLDRGKPGWATCPITENAILRIFGHARYPGGPSSPAGASELLDAMRGSGGHVFWSDEISLLDAPNVSLERLGASAQVTDTYLLALAVHHGGRLATLDRRISTQAVEGGAEALSVIA